VFLLTDKRAIVRFSSSVTTTDDISIAIERVKGIEITTCGPTYGSVYLSYDETPPPENSQNIGLGDLQRRPIRRTSVASERPASIWILLSRWPRWSGFYGFKGFAEFANIIGEQRNSALDVNVGDDVMRDTR
jgi:hypothetical protein